MYSETCIINNIINIYNQTVAITKTSTRICLNKFHQAIFWNEIIHITIEFVSLWRCTVPRKTILCYFILKGSFDDVMVIYYFYTIDESLYYVLLLVAKGSQRCFFPFVATKPVVSSAHFLRKLSFRQCILRYFCLE